MVYVHDPQDLSLTHCWHYHSMTYTNFVHVTYIIYCICKKKSIYFIQHWGQLLCIFFTMMQFGKTSILDGFSCGQRMLFFLFIPDKHKRSDNLIGYLGPCHFFNPQVHYSVEDQVEKLDTSILDSAPPAL